MKERAKKKKGRGVSFSLIYLVILRKKSRKLKMITSVKDQYGTKL